MTARFANPITKLPRNELGRDFVVGDIHGSFDLCIEAMRSSRFDVRVDRLISVGDLIDRGPHSHRATKFLSCPFVHAVRGNHEDMVLEIYQEGRPHDAVIEMMACRNGFDWWLDAPERLRAEMVTAFRALPLAIEVDTADGPVGIVHADVAAGLSWPQFKDRLERGDERVAHDALWGRDRVGVGDETGVAGVHRVYVGHTPLEERRRFGNVFAIDTGAVFGLLGKGGGHLTFVEVCVPEREFDVYRDLTASP